MKDSRLEPFLKLHGISDSNYKVMCEQLHVDQLTPLDKPWVCTRCGFVRIFAEAKYAHIQWHERRNKQ